MTDATAHLHAPLGQPGSGRVRYGAAMALWQAGGITAEVLEVYRVAAAHDGRDPQAMLRDRGLPLPQMAQPPAPLPRLYGAARDYLLGLHHAGAAEVRAGLPPDPGPARHSAGHRHGVADRWLEPALALVAMDQPHLAAAIGAAADQLAWTLHDDVFPPDQTGTGLAGDCAGGHAGVYAIAPLFAVDDVAMWLLLMAPHVQWRAQAHLAPMLYAPLTGPHGWRFGTHPNAGRPLITTPAHQPVWNPPQRPHLISVGPAPLLCLCVRPKDPRAMARGLAPDEGTMVADARPA